MSRPDRDIYICDLNASATTTGVEATTPVSISDIPTLVDKRFNGRRLVGTGNKLKYGKNKVAMSSKNEIAKYTHYQEGKGLEEKVEEW